LTTHFLLDKSFGGSVAIKADESVMTVTPNDAVSAIYGASPMPY